MLRHQADSPSEHLCTCFSCCPLPSPIPPCPAHTACSYLTVRSRRLQLTSDNKNVVLNYAILILQTRRSVGLLLVSRQIGSNENPLLCWQDITVRAFASTPRGITASLFITPRCTWR